MSKTAFFTSITLCALFFAACQQTPEPKSAVQETPKPDLVKIKAEIQALNNTWAAASDAKDVATILTIYADDAISMPDGEPMLVGKVAIQKDLETSFANREEANFVTYETSEVFGDENMVTETGKVKVKDPSGNLKYTEKYMQIWEKRKGKWQVIREIYNHDAKVK